MLLCFGAPDQTLNALDALFCAYLAYYFWYWRWETNEIFGDLHSGYILNLKLLATLDKLIFDLRCDDSEGFLHLFITIEEVR